METEVRIVSPRIGPLRPGPCPPAETAAEEATENIAQVAEIEITGEASAIAARAAAVIGIDAGKAELIVLRLFVRIAQYFVSLVGLFKARLTRLVAGVQIGGDFPWPACGKRALCPHRWRFWKPRAPRNNLVFVQPYLIHLAYKLQMGRGNSPSHWQSGIRFLYWLFLFSSSSTTL